MKRILLGTTALVAAAGFSGLASAQQVTTKATSLSISGNVEFDGAYVDSDGASADRKVDFLTDADLTFTPKFVADNGLTVIGRLDYDATSTGTPDELSITFQSASFGSATLGNDDGAADNFYQQGPLAGENSGWDAAWDGNATKFTDAINWDGDNIEPNVNGDSTKVYYSTKGLDLAGFTFGASFTPTADNAFNNGNLTNTGRAVGQDPVFDNVWDVGGTWDGEFSGVKLTIGGVYTTGDGKAGTDNFNAYNVGGTIGYGAFAVGGGYTAYDSLYGNNSDDDVWAVGATYNVGAFTVGATYTKTDYEAGSVVADSSTTSRRLNDSSAYGVGVYYAVAPGVTARGEVNQFKNDDSGEDATVVLLGTKVDF